MSEQDDLAKALGNYMSQKEEPDFKITLTQRQLNQIVRSNMKRAAEEEHMADHSQKITVFGIGLIGIILYLFLL